MIHKNNITITNAGGHPEAMFTAPDEEVAARSLLVYLAENLRPGLVIELDIGAEKLTLPTGEKIPPKLYSAVMGGVE